MPFELPTIVIPMLVYNMLLCGLSAAIAWHLGLIIERAIKARVRSDK